MSIISFFIDGYFVKDHLTNRETSVNEITGILMHIDSFLGHMTQIFLLYRDCFLRY